MEITEGRVEIDDEWVEETNELRIELTDELRLFDTLTDFPLTDFFLLFSFFSQFFLIFTTELRPFGFLRGLFPNGWSEPYIALCENGLSCIL